MNFRKLITEYTNRENKPRQKGRYYASELDKIRLGWFEPKDFYKQEEIDFQGCMNILKGEAYEKQLEHVFGAMNIDFQPQVKKEMEVDGLTIVVKPDFVFRDFVLETKAPTPKTIAKIEEGNIPRWYLAQLTAESKAFGRPVKLGVFKEPFNLLTMDYTPSEKLWSNTIKKLKEFHSSL